MFESGQILDNPLHPEETFAARIRFVAAHHGGPLFGGHGARSGVGQQIDQDILGVDQEQIVAGLLEEAFALFRRGVVERLHALDTEWLDDGFHRNRRSLRIL